MNRSLLAGAVLGAAVVTAGGAFAGFQLLDREPAFAEVLDVQPITETVKTPREVCYDVTVAHAQQSRDQHKITGTVIGAVVGGVLGSQVGSGDGRKVATAAGAAAGGYAGNRVQNKMQQGNASTRNEQRCETVYDSHDRQAGFNVRYRLGEEEGSVQMDRHPGERIPVQDGQLVLEQRGPEQES